MFDDQLSFSKVVQSLEGTLGIEYEESARVDEILDAAIRRLEEKYGHTLDKDIYTSQNKNQLSADSINKFLADLQSNLEQFAFFVLLKVYHKNLPLSLAEVSYLGYAKEKLLTSLKYMQDANAYAVIGKADLIPLSHQLNNIPMCMVKRLFVILLMLARLGVVEGVSMIAHLLYLGGLVA